MNINYKKRVISYGITVLFLLLSNLIYSQPKNTNGTILLKDGWYICPAEKVAGNGSLISSEKYSVKEWYPASVPSTVLGTLVNDSVYKNVFVGDNLKNIPAEQFKKPWWYRTEFKLPQSETGKTIKLEFDGIVYRANVWLNGKQIAGSDTMAGVFRRFEFDITNIAEKKNILAVEVFPCQPGEPSVGFADWNPDPPDNSMGIWREVKLKISGNVSLNYPFVKSKVDLETFKFAELTVSAEVKNNTANKINGVLYGEIGGIKISKKIVLEPLENSVVTFTPAEYSQLKINNPRIWWTYNLGKPELYNLKLKFDIDGKTSDVCSTKFGIREVSDYINEDGFRGYKLNGKKVLIAGGGWVDNLFLNNDYKNIKTQIEYVKQMGLNAIRLEGFWGTTDDLYNICDEYGVLIMAGWSCQWENDEYIGKHVDDFGGIKSPGDIKLIAQSWEDQVKWLRNHPAIFLWLYGSDRLPRPELEKEYLAILKRIDETRPVLAAAGEHTSELTGKTAVKMRGPYDYVAPIYWWTDKSRGGAFGFNTEVGPGVEMPAIESIKKMIPENHLWPIDSVWNFHCGKMTFSNLKVFNSALSNRLGEPLDLNDYCTKAQFLSYEGTRAMFEAHIANKNAATGVIHWMLNSAWPKLWWQFYDYYLNPAGAFYGTKKACEPIHILYNYGNASIMVVNNTINQQNNLTAKIEVLNFNLSGKYSKSISLNLSPDESKEILKLPVINDLSKTYFVNLKLIKGKEVVSSNLYCLSSKPDILDTANASWCATPDKQFADLTDLSKLEKTNLSVKQSINTINGREEIETEIFNNTDKLAFQVVLSVNKGKNGECVLPIFWDDNYFSLFPGEKRKIKGYFSKTDLGGAVPVLKVSGWNLK
jgi:exo-1,4-beta-D-glucosaminidase